MSNIIKISVPDIGDFIDVPVVEVLVKAGEQVEAEQSLITLESDKAVMEIPAPAAGIVRTVDVAEGDFVSEGWLVATMEADELPAASPVSEKPKAPAKPVEAPQTTTAIEEETIPDVDYDFDVLVLGAGPGGYTAAFRAADLGLKVVLTERDNAILVPEAALFRSEGEWRAFVIEDGRARLVKVETGIRDGRKREVLDGLAEHDQIIIHPDAALEDGARVAPPD